MESQPTVSQPAESQPVESQPVENRPAVNQPAGQGAGSAAYTIMVYIAGANLESEAGLASEDLDEMIRARFSRQDINVVVQTGGAKRWSAPDISATELGRYVVGESGLEKLETLPQANMVLPPTVTDFINFSYRNYPAQKYGFVFWDHGAGPLLGFGVDENFDEMDMLSLPELRDAISNSSIASQPLEFIGFDSCVMASIEIADQLSPYAKYMIGSQELEPGKGWDYTSWLSSLGSNPNMSGAELGREIADSFIAFYETTDLQGAPLALSVIDTAKSRDVVSKLETFVGADGISKLSFENIARDRVNTKEFAKSTADSGMPMDIVDLADMAKQFNEANAEESAALQESVKQAVLYNTTSQDLTGASGLSVYFPYNDTNYLKDNMEVYKATGFSPTYVAFLDNFVNTLTSRSNTSLNGVNRIQPTQATVTGQARGGSYEFKLSPEQANSVGDTDFEVWEQVSGNTYRRVYHDENAQMDNNTGEMRAVYNGALTTIGGETAALYEYDRGENYVRYQAPATLNGKDVYLLFLSNEANPEPRLIAAQPTPGKSGIPSRQLVQIKEGDKIALSHYEQDISADGTDKGTWKSGKEFTVNTGKLATGKTEAASGTYIANFSIIDVLNNKYLTGSIAV